MVGIYALGKADMRSTASLRHFPSVAFASVDLTDDGLSGFTAVWLAGAEKDRCKASRKTTPVDAS